MKRIGDRVVPEGTVIAIESVEDGAIFTVEMDERVNTRMSGAAAGYETRFAAQPLQAERVRVSAARWAEIQARGSDEFLARRMTIEDIRGDA